MSLRKPILHNFHKLSVALLGLLSLLLISQAVLAAPCDIKPVPLPFVQHDLSNSYGELCGYGYISVVIANPYQYTPNPPNPDIPGATMSNMELVEQLGISGLEYDPTAPVPQVTYQVNSGIIQVGLAPIIGGGGTTLTFTSNEIPALTLLESNPNINQINTITITFAVRRTSDPEGLIGANRTIQANLTFNTDSGCADSPESDTDTLPLREPIPTVTKAGWNYDAGQRQSSQTDPVYGNNNDDVVWRIQIDNPSLVGLQDLRFDDLMDAGSVAIS
ncbi:MAG: hypothetical protein GQ563_08825, partial [Desulfuromusa sp.]|nr:hypothetical protein [Desulfuromusa sp.]